MAYILIARDPDGSMRLLAALPFETRQHALSELSRLSADHPYEAWDSEVFLFDLDTATPVLFVHAAAALPMSEISAASSSTDSSPTTASFAPPVAAEIAAAPVIFSSPAAPAPEEPTAPTQQESAPQEGDAYAWLADVDRASVGDSAIEDAIVQEAEDAEASEVVQDAQDQSAFGGPQAPAASESVVADMIPAPPAPLVPPLPETTVAELRSVFERRAEMERGEPTASTGTASDLERVGPDTRSDAAEAAQPEPAGEEQPESAATPERWPWDVRPSAPLPEDAESQAPSQSRDLEPTAAADGAEPSASVAAAERQPMPTQSSTWSTGPQVAAVQTPASGSGPDDLSSDFILDLEQPIPEPTLEPALAAEAPPADSAASGESEHAAQAEGATSPEVVQPITQPSPWAREQPAEPVLPSLAEYLCDDCAYADTCPNKDQRLPKDCGSFQWK